MYFGVELVPNEPVAKTCMYAKRAEEIGADFVWVTDHFNNRDAYVTLSALSMVTNRIRLGVGVTNPYTRHVTNTASAISTLNEISGGRMALGIGPGDSATFESLGIERRNPLPAVREAVHVSRLLLSGNTISFSGSQLNLSEIRLSYSKGESVIPVYVGAQGPKMLEMGGEIGDGVLINGSYPSDFDFAVSQIKKGAENALRPLEEIDIAAYTCFSIASDPEVAQNAAVPVVAFIVAGSPCALVEKHGISLKEKEAVAASIREGRFDSLEEVVTDRMIERFSISGDFDACQKRIFELADAGVTQIVAGSPLGPDKEKSFNSIQKIIKNIKEN